MTMKHTAAMDRFINVLPFSGCASNSSISTADLPPPPSPATAHPARSSSSSSRMGKGSKRPAAAAASGLRKLVKGLKSLLASAQFFQLYEEDEVEREMEIGFPTDVKHVAHIGWDGSSGDTSAAAAPAGNLKSWNKAPELVAMPAFSLKQFELAMVSQGLAGSGRAPAVVFAGDGRHLY